MGSIPARAGEPRSWGARSPKRRVYPRACGGTSGSYRCRGSSPGLSPRVRGNPRGSPWYLGMVKVYPRACGGTVTHAESVSRSVGLSPRVRGNLNRKAIALLWVRSIPARAGEPEPVTTTAAPTRVYPRACGGTRGDADLIPAERGLSPRVRGNLTPPNRSAARLGSIPARAGEPSSSASS